MGMAASQARFLGLTARRNNIEFEGQQINQQRTCLANQSANYYNDLLGMKVPTPPSVDEFTKTVYTFTDGALTNTITALIAKSNGEYSLSYIQAFDDDFTPVFDSTAIITRPEYDLSQLSGYSVNNSKFEDYQSVTVQQTPNTNPATYEVVDSNDPTIVYVKGLTQDAQNTNKYISEDALREYTFDPANNTVKGTFANLFDITHGSDTIAQFVELKSGTSGIYVKYNVGNDYLRTLGDDTLDTDENNEYFKTLSDKQKEKLIQEEKNYLTLLNDKYGTQNWLVRYVENTTTGIWEPVFYKKQEVEAAIYDTNSNSQSNIKAYKMGSEAKTTEVKNVQHCKIEKDSTGRFMNLTVPDENGNETTYSLITQTVTDQDAYNDAMNQYEYDKYQYDQAIQEINSKIEIVQAQDKNLELRLKQLDTEHNAVQNEIEAVSKVIQKNTEDSFKTFNA